MHNRRAFLASRLAPLCTAALVPTWARAQDASPKLITLVVGIAAGSVTDVVARIVARQLAQQLKTTVIVDNKPGAGQIIGINLLKTRPPDGSTLLFMAGSGLGQAPAIRTDLTYQPLRDFTFVARSAVTAGVIVASPTFKAATVKDLIAQAKERPGEVAYGSAGLASAGHLQMELIMRLTGAKMNHVPFKSDTQVVLELVEGRLDTAIVAAAAALPLYKAGRLKILAATSRTPLAFLPGIPTLPDTGIAGIEGLDPFTFFGIVGPAGMPPELVRQLNEAHNAGMRDPQVTAQLRENLSSEPITESPDAFRRFVTGELAKWGEIGKDLKLN